MKSSQGASGGNSTPSSTDRTALVLSSMFLALPGKHMTAPYSGHRRPSAKDLAVLRTGASRFDSDLARKGVPLALRALDGHRRKRLDPMSCANYFRSNPVSYDMDPTESTLLCVGASSD